MDPTSANPDDAVLQVRGRELLIRHLGYWPTFEDFEVLSIHLERPLVTAALIDLRATFLIWDMRNRAQTAADGKQGTVEILFESATGIEISGFNYQNPMAFFSLAISDIPGEEGKFEVKWGGSCIHHEVSFFCGGISIVRVVDLNPFQKPCPFI